ncbi:thioredoxin family protein [candidate division KSB1 bacterium]|nr:thioredoxin family protein [candidate division KSB1 bacterium]
MKRSAFSTIIAMLMFLMISSGCGKNEAQSRADTGKQQGKNMNADSTQNNKIPKVTFFELGSVSCIPCKMMQPVMKAIEEEFGDQIEVVFHDVRKDPATGKKYGIRVIPTQVFLDESGKEFFRHQGYFPKEEIEKLLVKNGLKILKQVEIEK